ncbi:uncharacterized protein LOC125035270 [Penaeus chinensis]|uniref:uncharacterized protein LOC125035270 n=1 Tax=Penaeus chinensis TaxID=139456 RepID=UPI001FB63154|nr:uncharacterized protein LOC125035270 [Penaeus chinensis]
MKLLSVSVFTVVLAFALAGARKRPEHKVDKGCPWQLCNATGNIEFCSSCVQGLIDEGILPEKELFQCFNKTGDCHGFQSDDLADLRNCMTSASARLGECIALPEADTVNY